MNENININNTNINKDVIAAEHFLPKMRLIVACDHDFIIGHENNLPWHLGLDLKLFKAKTLDQHIVMGYNTFQSIIARSGKPLPRRTHWVLTKKDIKTLPEYEFVNYISNIEACIKCLQYLSYQDFLLKPKNNLNNLNDLNNNDDNNIITENLWVIGGAQIYNLLKNHELLSEMHITYIKQSHVGDAYLNISDADWQHWQLKTETPLLDAFLDKFLENALDEFVKNSNLKEVPSLPELPPLSELEKNTTVKIYQRINQRI